MATVLSLPRLPAVSPPLATAASSRFPTSQCGVCNFRHPIWCAVASDRTSRNVVDGASSIGGERNVGLETHAARCCSSEEQGACSTSGCGSAGIGPGRREVLSATFGAAVLGVFGGGGEALARDRRNKKEISAEDYLTSGAFTSYHLWER